MTPDITVVIPVRDRAVVIDRALESVAHQTYDNWEAVVIDDGSTDDTCDVVASWADRDDRIRLVSHQQSRGAQAARNTGIRAARGSWVAFLDSDDEYLPESLGKRLRKANAFDSLVVHSECLIRENDEPDPRPFGVPPLTGQVYPALLRRPGPLFPALLVRRDLVLAIGGLDERVPAFQEWDTAIRLARVAEFAFVADPTFIYDCRLEVTISKDLARSARGYRMIVAKHRWEILTRLGPRALSDHYVALSGLYRAGGDRARAVCSLAFGAMLWPYRPARVKRWLAPAMRGGHGRGAE